jgi:hypothetical protein
MKVTFLRNWLLPICLLLATVLALHGSAINGGWRFDDAAHLLFVSKYSIVEYFLIPKVMYEQSFANVTPWNALTYDLNLALFGPRPKYFYAHQLISLWLASVAIFWLARKYMSLVWALVASLLFVSAASSAHIAQELMTGHYVEGMIFAVLSIGCLTQSTSSSKYWLSVVFYFLSVNCKEVYVPLPLLLFFLPGGVTHTQAAEEFTLKSVQKWFLLRFRFFLPHIIVLALYLVWRHQILGGIVSNNFASVGVLEKLGKFTAMVPKFGQILFGASVLGTLATLASLALIVRGLIAPWRITFIVGAFVLLLPLTQLATSASISSPDRYYFALWAGFSYLVGVVGSGAATRIGQAVAALAAIGVLTATVCTGLEETKVLQRFGHMWEQSYQFVSCDGDKSQTYIIPANGDLVDHAYWDEMMMQYSVFSMQFSKDKLCKPPSFVNIAYVLTHLNLSTTTPVDFLLTALQSSEVMTYGEDCQCIRRIRVDEILQRDKQKKYRFVDEPMSIEYTYDVNSHMLDMKFGPYSDGFKLLLTDPAGKASLFEMPSGTYHGIIDANLAGDLIAFHVGGDGKIIRSPTMPFPPPRGGFGWRQ